MHLIESKNRCTIVSHNKAVMDKKLLSIVRMDKKMPLEKAIGCVFKDEEKKELQKE